MQAPPVYTPSPSAPLYSSQPSSDEQRLEYGPHLGPPPSPTGIYVKKSRRTTLILKDQDETAQSPSYGRNSVVSGELSLERCETVLAVVLKVMSSSCILITASLHKVFTSSKADWTCFYLKVAPRPQSSCQTSILFGEKRVRHLHPAQAFFPSRVSSRPCTTMETEHVLYPRHTKYHSQEFQGWLSDAPILSPSSLPRLAIAVCFSGQIVKSEHHVEYDRHPVTGPVSNDVIASGSV